MEDFVKSILSKAEALDAEKRKAVADALRKAADELVKAAPMEEEDKGNKPQEKADDAGAPDVCSDAGSDAGSQVDTTKALDGGWPLDLTKSLKPKE